MLMQQYENINISEEIIKRGLWDSYTLLYSRFR
jgi:hypothetical protein